MSDLQRQLEELFMSDSRSRRVDQVNVVARPRSGVAPIAFVGAVTLATLALILAFSYLRGGDTVPASSPSPSASAAAVASGNPSATPSGSASPNATASTGPASTPKPDAKHGLITFDAIRTEDDATNLQRPPQFSRSSATNNFSVAVSPDGKRVAMIRTGQVGQDLITYTTARPNDVTKVVDFAGSGETVGGFVWAGDGSDSVLVQMDKVASPQPDATAEYSSLRRVDIATKQVSEIARITTGDRLVPLAWLPGRGIAAASEVRGGGAKNYDLIQGSSIQRTPINALVLVQLRGSRDGSRILVVDGPGLRWWPVEQPAEVRALQPDSTSRAEYAEFRPGTNEIGVSVVSSSTGAPGASHFEIWDLSSGKQRVVSPTVGFSRWRVDGSAAINVSDLVDPDTGATTPIPGGAFKIAEVVLF